MRKASMMTLLADSLFVTDVKNVTMILCGYGYAIGK